MGGKMCLTVSKRGRKTRKQEVKRSMVVGCIHAGHSKSDQMNSEACRPWVSTKWDVHCWQCCLKQLHKADPPTRQQSHGLHKDLIALHLMSSKKWNAERWVQCFRCGDAQCGKWLGADRCALLVCYIKADKCISSCDTYSFLSPVHRHICRGSKMKIQRNS